MGKVIGTIILFAIIAVVTVATGGIGAGFFAAVGEGVAGVILGTGLVATIGVYTAVAIGGALVGAAFAALGALAKPKVPATNNETTARLNKTLVPDEARKIVLGETCAPSDIRYWETAGTNNVDYNEVIAVATHKVQSMGLMFLEDQQINVDGSGYNTGGPYGSNFRMRDVTEGGQGIGPTLSSVWNPSAGSNSTRMTGLAYYVLNYIYDQKVWPKGFPSRYTRIVKGALVYDPRLDSTNGGSGSHRPTDHSTWEYTHSAVDIGRNPALQVLWYLLGWYITDPADSTKKTLVAGMGVDPNDIDLAAFIQAANDADSMGYKCDVALSAGDDHAQNLSIILATCGGSLTDGGGRYSMIVSIDDTASVAVTLTADDIVGGFDWVPKNTMRDQFNSVVGKFTDPTTSPAILYQPMPYPKVSDSGYETSDGFKRSIVADFIGVQDPVRAQTLGRIILNRSRFQGVFKAPFNMKAFLAKQFSIVKFTFPQLAFVNKVFRVIEYGITPLGIIQLTLQEDDPAIYTPGSVTTPSAPSSINAFDPKQKVAITGLVAVVSNDVDVSVTWDTPGQLVRRTDVEYMRTGIDTNWTTGGPVDPSAGLTLPGLDVAQAYQVRARHVTIFGIVGDWVVASVTTGGSVTPPDVSTFNAYPGEDRVRFEFVPVSFSEPVDYEIREGTVWNDSAPVVSRTASATVTVQEPVGTANNRSFLIKAIVRRTGTYSANAILATTYQAPITDRNELDLFDFSAISTGWVGPKQDLTSSGSHPDAILTLNVDGTGVRLPFGDYHDEVDLGATYYARNWHDTTTGRTNASSATWASLDPTLTWNDTGDLTWGGGVTPTGDATMEVKIAIDTAPSDFVEGWRGNSATTGVNGTAVGGSSGVTYSDCWRAKGFDLDTDTDTIYWDLASGLQTFTIAFDWKPDATLSGSVRTLLRFGETDDDPRLELVFIPGSNLLRLRKYVGGVTTTLIDLAFTATLDTTDIFTFAVVQSSTTVTLFWNSRRDRTVRTGSTALTPLSTLMKRVRLGDATVVAKGVFGDVELRTSKWSVDDFTTLSDLRGPAGFSPYRTLYAGDYNYRKGSLWWRLSGVQAVGDTLAISEALLYVDLPDINDRGRATISSGGTTVAYNRTFNITPEVMAVQVSGTPGLVQVTNITQTNFKVTIYDRATGANTGSGDVSWSAHGY